MQSFAAHDHTASIRCVAHSGNYVASGGADDRIFIYNLKSRKEHCSLTHHNATITCMEFTANHSHLMSASSDGVLAMTRVGNWQLEKVWEKAHKGASVLDIAIHPSGKLALSLGADCSLCTWNLVKGRQAYIINLNNKSTDARSLEKIIWSPDGVKFILYGGKYTEVWSIESGGVLQHIQHEERVTSCIWLTESVLLVGHETGEITVKNVEDDSQFVFKAHESRVKAICLYQNWIITVSSSGQIKIWNKDFEEISKIDSGCRLTCLCVVDSMEVKKEKIQEEVGVSEEKSETKRFQPKVVTVVDNDDEVKVVKRKPTVTIEMSKKKRKKKKKSME